MTIEEALDEFLAEQERRLKPRTYSRYAEVVFLLRDSLNRYGHQSLDEDEQRRLKRHGPDDDEAFVRVFGPDKIAENLGEFLGYFMVSKVMAGEELLRAAGTVTKKLAQWLGERGYLDPDSVEIAVERGAEATRDLPAAERLSRLLYESSRQGRLDPRTLCDDDYIEDFLMIDRVDSGSLWF